MEIKLLKLLEANIMKGDLNSVEDVLQNEKQIPTKKAIYLLVTCCKACCNLMDDSIKDNSKSIKEMDLLAVVQRLSGFIVSINEHEFDSYLQSMFFICKYLLKQDIRFILELEYEILPGWMPRPITDNQKGTYRSICNLIMNNFVTTIGSQKKVDQRNIISISRLISSLIRTCQDLSIFCTYVYKFSMSWISLKLSCDIQFKYFLINFDIMQKENEKDQYGSILNFSEYGLFLFAEFLKNGELQISKLCLEKLFAIIPNSEEWINWKEIFKLCDFMLDISRDDFDLSKFKTAIVNAVKYKDMQSMWKYIANVVKSFSHFCKHHVSNEFFNCYNLHLKLYEAINEIVKILNHEFKPCQGECICLGQKQISEGATIMVSVINLFSTLLSNNNMPAQNIDEMLGHIQSYCDFLTSLEVNNCEKRDVHWSNIEVHIHNLGVVLYKKRYFSKVILLGELILKCSYLLSTVKNNKVLLKTKSLISSGYLGEQKYREALIWVASEIIDTPKELRMNALQAWIKIKLEAKTHNGCSTLQVITIVSAIEKAQSEFEFISKSMNKEDKEELLKEELEIYDRKWKSKLPMMSAFRELCIIADNFTLMKVFAKIFMDWHINVHDDMFKLLDEIFLEFENSHKDQIDTNRRFIIALINLFRYRNQMTENIKKNVMEMNKNVKVYKAPPVHPSDVLSNDVYSECDVICLYEGLKLNKSELKILEKCLNELEEIVLSDSFKLLDDIMDLEKLYILTKNIAMEFNLNNDSFKCIKAFQVAQIIAKHLKNDFFFLESTGYIMKFSYNCQLEEKMSTIISNMAINEKSYEYLVQYFINMTDVYISKKETEKALQYFERALRTFETWSNETTSSDWWYNVLIEYFRYRMVEVQIAATTVLKIDSRFGPLLKAHDLIVEKYCSGWEWGPSCFSLLFDVMIALIAMYYELRMPREVRCFGEDALQVAQQYMIPIKCVKILTYLAKSDLQSEHFDNCRVKLDGIAEILELKKKPEEINNVSQLTQGIQDLKLEYKNLLNYERNLSPSSPIHHDQTYSLDFLFNHENCSCISCSSIAYQCLVLTSFHLEALWHTQKNQITLANRFFRECLKLYEMYCEKPSIKRIPDVEYESDELSSYFEECNFRCLVDYVKFLYISGAVEDAKKYNGDLLEKLSMKKIYFPTLYSETVLQQLALLYEIGNKEMERIQEIEKEQSSVNSEDYIIKTPEHVQNNPYFVEKKDVQNNSSFVEKKAKKIKVIRPNVIKFNLKDAESDSSKKTPLKKDIKEQLFLETPKRLPPSLRSRKTPVITLKFDSSNVMPIPLETRSGTSSEFERRNRIPSSKLSESAVKNGLHDQENQTKECAYDRNIKENLMEVNTKKLISKLKKKLPDESNTETDDQSQNSLKTKKVIDGDTYPLRRTRRNRT